MERRKIIYLVTGTTISAIIAIITNIPILVLIGFFASLNIDKLRIAFLKSRCSINHYQVVQKQYRSFLLLTERIKLLLENLSLIEENMELQEKLETYLIFSKKELEEKVSHRNEELIECYKELEDLIKTLKVEKKFLTKQKYKKLLELETSIIRDTGRV